MDKIYRKILSQCVGFDWDDGHFDKNRLKHKVSPTECEQLFFNHPLAIEDVTKHSAMGKKFYLLGQTDLKRTLSIAFTVRNNLIRVISARDMNRKEWEVYNNG